MLINLSNHPSNKWSQKQLKTALKKYKSVTDLPFPNISPYSSTSQVITKAKKYLLKVIKLLNDFKGENNAVHLMGEFTFVYHLTNMLKQKKIKVVASTTERIVEESNGNKIVTFKFVRFREY